MAIYVNLAERLQRAGAGRIAVTSIAGHFCIEAFNAVSPLPVIDLLEVVKQEVKRRALTRVGLIGTRAVMESRFYGVLDGVEVMAPLDNLSEVHKAYVAMASAGIATTAQLEVFLRTGASLTRMHGCESILLAGTDLALVFGKGIDPGFDTLDCAQVHEMAIADLAMGRQKVV